VLAEPGGRKNTGELAFGAGCSGCFTLHPVVQPVLLIVEAVDADAVALPLHGTNDMGWLPVSVQPVTAKHDLPMASATKEISPVLSKVQS
jgi:hypothetical protein